MTDHALSRRTRTGRPPRAVVRTTAALAATGLLVAAAVSPATATTPDGHPAAPAWHRCSAETPAEFECATVVAPLDHTRPYGRTISLSISRIRTSKPGVRHGVLMFNPGGPGGPGLDMPLAMRARLPGDVLDRYDLIGFDPRGVGRSSPISCDLTGDDSTGLGPPEFRPATFGTDVARARRVAGKCAAHADVLAHITTRATARDMDLIRGALGEPTLSFMGFYYGTYLGATYTRLFPHRAGRIVLDSAVDPQLAWRDVLRSRSVGGEQAFTHLTEWAARRPGEYGLGTTAAQVRQTFLDLVARAERAPIRYDDQDWTGEDIRRAFRWDVFWAKGAAERLAGLHRAATGLPTGPPAGTDPPPGPEHPSLPADPATPKDNLDAVFWAIACNDVTTWPRDPQRYRRDAEQDERRYALFGGGPANITPCAFWTVPHTERDATVGNPVGALVVQNQWDPQTPEYVGRGLHRALTGSRLVFGRNGSGHVVYGSGNTCADDAVDRYLVTGRLPAADLTCAVAQS